MHKRKLILTGFMAAGKSATARALSSRLGWRLIDSDRIISARAGKSIAAIFAEDGEARFRKLEREVIREIAQDRRRCPQCGEPMPAIVAAGGGALVDDNNYRALAAAGVIIGLTADPSVIAARVAGSREVRPKLSASGKPLLQAITELMEQRREAYAKAAATIDTSSLSVRQGAERALEEFVARA